MWKAIWNIGVPRVVKMFLWKACSNILPTKEKLFKKHITHGPLCPICSLEIETIGHIFWSCPSARDLWTECRHKIYKSTSDENDFMSIMEKLMERASVEKMQMVAIVARQIWHKRNTMVFGGKCTSPTALLRTSMEQMEAYSKAKWQVNNQWPVPRKSVIEPWQKPSTRFIKVNWDAFVDLKGKRIEIEIIVRDHGRSVVSMLCETKANVQDVTTKALAAWKGVELSAALGLRKIIMEGDVLDIVQALRKRGGDWDHMEKY